MSEMTAIIGFGVVPFGTPPDISPETTASRPGFGEGSNVGLYMSGKTRNICPRLGGTIAIRAVQPADLRFCVAHPYFQKTSGSRITPVNATPAVSLSLLHADSPLATAPEFEPGKTILAVSAYNWPMGATISLRVERKIGTNIRRGSKYAALSPNKEIGVITEAVYIAVRHNPAAFRFLWEKLRSVFTTPPF